MPDVPTHCHLWRFPKLCLKCWCDSRTPTRVFGYPPGVRPGEINSIGIRHTRPGTGDSFQIAITNDSNEEQMLPEGLIIMAFGKVTYKNIAQGKEIDPATERCIVLAERHASSDGLCSAMRAAPAAALPDASASVMMPHRVA